MSLSRGDASRTEWQQSNKATVTTKGKPSTSSAVRSSRGRERGREGGRADIRPELLSPQKLFKEITQAKTNNFICRDYIIFCHGVCEILLTCYRSVINILSYTDHRKLPRPLSPAPGCTLKSIEIDEPIDQTKCRELQNCTLLPDSTMSRSVLSQMSHRLRH
jgi:hypothetical protein